MPLISVRPVTRLNARFFLERGALQEFVSPKYDFPANAHGKFTDVIKNVSGSFQMSPSFPYGCITFGDRF